MATDLAGTARARVALRTAAVHFSPPATSPPPQHYFVDALCFVTVLLHQVCRGAVRCRGLCCVLPNANSLNLLYCCWSAACDAVPMMMVAVAVAKYPKFFFFLPSLQSERKRSPFMKLLLFSLFLSLASTNPPSPPSLPFPVLPDKHRLLRLPRGSCPISFGNALTYPGSRPRSDRSSENLYILRFAHMSCGVSAILANRRR